MSCARALWPLALLWAGCSSCGAAQRSDVPAVSPSPIASEAAPEPTLLGDATTCEPSAAIVAPWDPDTILVADNEDEDRLFAYTRSGTSLIGPRPFPLGGRRTPHDIEALAATADGALLVVGSHSRKRDCSEASSRQRLRWVDSSGAPLAQADEFSLGSSAAECVTRLFLDPAPEHAPALCALLVARDSATECAGGLDIEGALTLGQRSWLGLRAPLLEGHAVLLRLVEARGQARFDTLVTVDLGGRGVRELSTDTEGSRVYGIAGPSGEDAESFELFVMSEGLSGPPTMLGTLPASSEGLVIETRGGALGAQVVLDGARGTDAACEAPGRQLWVPLATPAGL